MRAFQECWAYVLYILDAFSVSDHGKLPQKPLSGISPHVKDYKGPIFSPPSAPDDFYCNYSSMGSSWKHCSTADDRGCWLTNGTFKYDIHTDYESISPTGVVRKYKLDVTKMALQPDGYNFTDGQVFNSQYPGPWIQACWGKDL